MPPRRPFPDLCLISVFKQLTPNDQMKASRMSPRCLLLVRAANRRLKSLIIRTQNTYNGIEDQFMTFYYSKHCMQLIESNVPFARYLLNSSFSKWNCLILWGAVEDSLSTLVDQVVYLFSAVTDLKFEVRSEECEMMTELLHHPDWAGQLTDLMLAGDRSDACCDFNLASRVTTALNGLSSLQLLSINHFVCIDFSKLTILAQLKVIAVGNESRFYAPEKKPSFLHSFNRQSSNVTQKNLQQQQVYLIWDSDIFYGDEYPINDLLELSELDCSRIVGFYYLYYTPARHDMVLRLCTKLTSLVSLALEIDVPPQTPLPTTVVPLFNALTQLKQLLYLELSVSLEESEESPPLPSQPLSVQLSSVRALHLVLEISTHAQVKWLNLAQTLPNCQVLHLTSYICFACGVNIDYFTKDFADYRIIWNDRSTALNCVRSTLTELHLGVHPSKIIFEIDRYSEESSLEQLLQSSPNQQ